MRKHSQDSRGESQLSPIKSSNGKLETLLQPAISCFRSPPHKETDSHGHEKRRVSVSATDLFRPICSLAIATTFITDSRGGNFHLLRIFMQPKTNSIAYAATPHQTRAWLSVSSAYWDINTASLCRCSVPRWTAQPNDKLLL